MFHSHVCGHQPAPGSRSNITYHQLSLSLARNGFGMFVFYYSGERIAARTSPLQNVAAVSVCTRICYDFCPPPPSPGATATALALRPHAPASNGECFQPVIRGQPLPVMRAYLVERTRVRHKRVHDDNACANTHTRTHTRSRKQHPRHAVRLCACGARHISRGPIKGTAVAHAFMRRTVMILQHKM